MKTNYYITPKPTKIMKMLWRACGADEYILMRSTYSDQVKYMCLGGIIIGTAIMSGLSSSYAFYTIFEPRGSALETTFHLKTAILSIFLGLLWGLMIYNIDRFIVSSTGKGDGTEEITWQELKGAIPRMIMGAIIAVTISKPIEIRMFKSEIDAALYEEQLKLEKEYIIRTKINFEKSLQVIQNEINKYDSIESTFKNDIDKIEKEYFDQLQGRAGSPQGNGPIAKKIENIIKEKEIKLDKWQKENQIKRKSLLTQKDSINKSMFVALNQSKEVSKKLDGLLERIKLSHKVAGNKITLFITLLFLAIELTPIFFKLMLVRSPYDYIEENIKELIKADNGIYVQYDYYKDKEGSERDLVTNLEHEKIIFEKLKLLELQKELTQLAINEYSKKMKEEILKNPEKFIKNIDNNEPEK